MTRKTDAEYAAMADDYAAHPPTADELLDAPEVDYTILRNGRPPKGATSRGRTPTTSVRLPQELRDQVEALARAEGVKASEIIRRATERYVLHERRSDHPRPQSRKSAR